MTFRDETVMGLKELKTMQIKNGEYKQTGNPQKARISLNITGSNWAGSDLNSKHVSVMCPIDQHQSN
jgi:hypothetical protein